MHLEEMRKQKPPLSTQQAVTKGTGGPVCDSITIAVESFRLVDPSNGERLRTIHPGEELVLAELVRLYGTTSFAVECVTTSFNGASVKSAEISDNVGGSVLDNNFPWILPTPLGENPGFWHVICQPFCGPDG